MRVGTVLNGDPAEQAGSEGVGAFGKELQLRSFGAIQHICAGLVHRGILRGEAWCGWAVMCVCEVGTEYLKCISGGLLFGFFFAASSSAGVGIGANAGGDQKFAGVVWSEFFNNDVFGGATEDTLGEFLELAFEVFGVDRAALLEFFAEGVEDESACGIETAVEVDSGCECFDAGGED